MKGRKMMSWTNFIMLMLLGVSTAGLTAAQTAIPIDTVSPATSRFGVGAQLGYFKSSGADQGTVYYGAEARYMIGSMLGFEATLGYRGEQVFNFGKVAGNELSANITSVPFTVSMIIFIPLRSTSLVPYGLVGAGLYLMTVDYSADINKVMGDQTETEGGVHLGLGAQVPLTPGIVAHADYRYLFVSEIFESSPVYDFSSKKYGGGLMSLGLMVFF
ncbi:porin family protein [bacterium]|nr:MAG: porin family protein [bacterium]